MKIKIKNPVYGVPITVVDKIADDGFIHCTHTSEEIVNKTFKVEGHEHDLNDKHESVSQLTINGVVNSNESLSDLPINNNERNEWSKCQLLDNDKRESKILQDIYSKDIKFIVIGAYNYSKDTDGKPWNAKIKDKYIYKRILVQKYENSTNSN